MLRHPAAWLRAVRHVVDEFMGALRRGCGRIAGRVGGIVVQAAAAGAGALRSRVWLGFAQRARSVLKDTPSRAFDWVGGSSGGLAVLAVTVGAGAGVGAVVFRYLITGFTVLFTGHLDYTILGRVPNPHLPQLGIWYVLLVPATGALIFGPLIQRFARETRGHGVPEVMLAVAEKGGRIRPRVAVVKALASALCIGSGGSVGREGPIVQIGSALGSALGQRLHVPDSRLRLLVACGAAGGISATFNAPLAGVFFALEIILINFQAGSFALVVLSSVTADVIGRAAFGAHPFLVLPPFELVGYWEYLLYAALGVLAAIAGIAFIRVLYGLEDILDRIWPFAEWLRPVAGGAVLGVVILALPEMYGVGYPVISRIIEGHFVAWFLLILLAGKMLATSLTLSSGGSGGVFAPSLFMGAALGTAFGAGVHALLPAATATPGAYGLVGMGAVFAAAARAPITSVLIVFELTGDYRIILPLMFAVALSTTLSRRMSRDSIYTLKLHRRGIDITQAGPAGLMDVLKVTDAMRPVPAVVGVNTPISDLPGQLDAVHADVLPVVAEQGAYRGVVTIDDIQAALRGGALERVAGDLTRDVPVLRRDQSLHEALDLLVTQEEQAIPVVEGGARRIAGWLGQRDVLVAYARRLRQEVGRAAVAPPPDQPVPPRRAGTSEWSSRGGTRSPRNSAGGAPWDSPAESGKETAPSGESSPTVQELRGYRLVDYRLERDDWPDGRRIDEVGLPTFSLVVAVRRGDEVFEPDAETVVREHDVLTILVPAAHAESVADLLKRSPSDTGSAV